MKLLNFFKSFYEKRKKEDNKDNHGDKKLYIPWEDKYSVNIEEIDEEHKQLVHMINELYSAMETGRGKEVLSLILDKLIDYVKTHFTAENILMEEISYPGREEHKKEHSNFIKKVLGFQKSFKEGKYGLSVEVIFYLKEWLMTHIMESDKKYSGFYKK
jgi:hemerythrin-like metal-binding protein